MSRIKAQEIFRISNDILVAAGVNTNQAKIIADSIVDAHRREKHTHGMGRLLIYVRKINSGQMSANTETTIIREKGVISVVDVHDGFGQVAAYEGMQKCIQMASIYGVGIVGVRNSNSFGTACYFGNIAANNNMIGIVMGNASKALCPTGGNKACLGTNPICFSFPGTDKQPNIVLDMACAVAARGKVRLALRNGETIPLNWGNDNNGQPSSDPAEVLKGSINAFGGYKGFGLATVVEMLAGVITGSAFGEDVKPLNTPEGFSRYGHFLCAISPEFFMDLEEYESRLDKLVEYIKSCGDEGSIFMPGEQSHNKILKNKEIITVPDSIIEDVNSLAEKLNVKKIVIE